MEHTEMLAWLRGSFIASCRTAAAQLPLPLASACRCRQHAASNGLLWRLPGVVVHSCGRQESFVHARRSDWFICQMCVARQHHSVDCLATLQHSTPTQGAACQLSRTNRMHRAHAPVGQFIRRSPTSPPCHASVQDWQRLWRPNPSKRQLLLSS